ncbi:MAG TPA: 1-deoxy-D-xylulose-5-phosphate synthase [Rikenellaceae bacterium]|nr:1-deoxy-D-xylulose-5-phosphate synthase [Rikenellaceae bacterium]
MYLEKINGPADIKKLSIDELNVLADEARHYLIEKVSNHGGHVGPNLGMVEATVALHYVFNSPVDKIVFDVSHQSYPHKILTGRKEAFMEAAHYDDVSGYSEPTESEHDLFVIGHTSTSISLACGLAKGRDLTGGKENVIAVIGDGSLSGGEALEGLNVAGSELNSNLIIIVNDNQMSIAENHGGLYKNLQLLRETNGKAEVNLFKAMGLEYLYVADGNDIASLIDAFQKVKDTDKPVVVHINTLKGKGLKFAEENKEQWHYSSPFNAETGEYKFHSDSEDYGDLTAKYLLDKIPSNPGLVAITSGTPTVFGFTKPRREQAGKQFVDVGIAEETAVAMASGIAKRGGKPVWGVYSTFIQRTYDQLSQDLCINDNPALILVYGGGIEGMNDVTHTCFYDIPLLCNIPNLIYLAPTCREEYFSMLDWAVAYKEHPVAIRVPVNGVISRPEVKTDDIDWSVSKYEIAHKGSRVAVLGLGAYYQLGEKACDALKEQGIDATLINPRIITSLDTKTLESLNIDHELVVTLEDGQIDGGWGEKVARFYGDSQMKVLVRGERKHFEDRYNLAELLKINRLTPELITEDVIKTLGK